MRKILVWKKILALFLTPDDGRAKASSNRGIVAASLQLRAFSVLRSRCIQPEGVIKKNSTPG